MRLCLRNPKTPISSLKKMFTKPNSPRPIPHCDIQCLCLWWCRRRSLTSLNRQSRSNFKAKVKKSTSINGPLNLNLTFKKMKIWKYVMLWVHWRFHRFGRRNTLTCVTCSCWAPSKATGAASCLGRKKNVSSTSTLLQLLQIQNHTRVIMFNSSSPSYYT